MNPWTWFADALPDSASEVEVLYADGRIDVVDAQTAIHRATVLDVHRHRAVCWRPWVEPEGWPGRLVGNAVGTSPETPNIEQ